MDENKRREDFEAERIRLGDEILDDIFGVGTWMREHVGIRAPSEWGEGEVALRISHDSEKERTEILRTIIKWGSREDNWEKMRRLMLF